MKRDRRRKMERDRTGDGEVPASLKRCLLRREL